MYLAGCTCFLLLVNEELTNGKPANIRNLDQKNKIKQKHQKRKINKAIYPITTTKFFSPLSFVVLNRCIWSERSIVLDIINITPNLIIPIGTFHLVIEITPYFNVCDLINSQR